MTPHNMAGEIVSAALHARREDQRLIAEARTGLDQAAREVGNRLASARRGDVQNRWLIGTGLGGAALGMLLYAALAGPVARRGAAERRGGKACVGRCRSRGSREH